MSKKIIGVTVGTQLPKPNFDQTDPTKGDYIKGDRSFLRAIKTINGVEPDDKGDIAIVTDDTMTQSGVAADAKATGDAIHGIQTLVGDQPVATQIASATESLVKTVNGAAPDANGDVTIEQYDILPVSKGGTNASEPVAARENLLMVVSATEPTSPTTGMLWFDIS